MADALASGASGSNTVWVQVPSPAFENEKTQTSGCLGLFLFQEYAIITTRIQLSERGCFHEN